MALTKFKCAGCGAVHLGFPEENRFPETECPVSSSDPGHQEAGVNQKLLSTIDRSPHLWIPLPPSPMTVHTTNTWMSEPHIDSFPTTYELDRQLHIEVQEEKEMKLVNDARREQ